MLSLFADKITNNTPNYQIFSGFSSFVPTFLCNFASRNDF